MFEHLRWNDPPLTAEMIHGSPELYFMHFWATGAPATVADGLRAALDVMAR